MELSPKLAIEAADSVYALRQSDDMRRARNDAPTLIESFDILGGTRMEARSGMGVASSRTGFGYVANGTGSRAGEVLVAIRGTYVTSASDWLTNIRIAGMRGPSGYTVHRGFMTLATEILEQVNGLLAGRNPSQIHVAGHSLGGAAATLVAEALQQRSGARNVSLYTFGAPRAGVELHSRHLTQALGADNIYRAYHKYDPVPWVPVFPYAHVPFGEQAYPLQGPGTLISIAAHKTGEYKKSVGDRQWAGLLDADNDSLDSLEAAEGWLGSAASTAGGMLSGRLLGMIMSALGWILRQVGHMAGYALLGGATIIDSIARLLYNGALMSAQISWMVMKLMGAILSFTGRTVAAGANVTVAFLTFVLETLFRVVSTMAARAVRIIS